MNVGLVDVEGVSVDQDATRLPEFQFATIQHDLVAAASSHSVDTTPDLGVSAIDGEILQGDGGVVVGRIDEYSLAGEGRRIDSYGDLGVGNGRLQRHRLGDAYVFQTRGDGQDSHVGR